MDAGAREYFSPPPTALWRWSDDVSAVETKLGQTIALREELLQYLRRLQPTGFPPFDSIILVLYGLRFLGNSAGQPDPGLKMSGGQAFSWEASLLQALSRLGEIPEPQRTSTAGREATLALIFEDYPQLRASDASRRLLSALAAGAPPRTLQEQESRSFRINERVKEWKQLADRLFQLDLRTIPAYLQTGLTLLPEPVVAEPPVEQPATNPSSQLVEELLRELEQQEEFRGFVQLAKNLQAMVRLPRKLQRAQELPVGGLADIANRGPLDRLLISELAQDEDALLLRVALNEALYVRREIPPDDPRDQRLVLFDCGLRMWGVPRVTGTALMLGLLATEQQGQGKSPGRTAEVPLQLFRAEGASVTKIDFSSRPGLLEHLAVLRPELHLGAALPAWRDLVGTEPNAESILITSPETWTDPAFQSSWRAAGRLDGYVFLIHREGEIELLQSSAAGSRLVRTWRHGIEQLLERSLPTAAPLVRADHGVRIPAFYLAQPGPLRVPEPVRWSESWYRWNLGVLSLTREGRLLLWPVSGSNPHHRRGPYELSREIPPGELCWVGAPSSVNSNLLFALRQRPARQCLLVDVGSNNELPGATSGPLLSPRVMATIPDPEGTAFIRKHGDVLYAVSHIGLEATVTEYSRLTGKELSQWTLPDDAWPIPGGRFFWRSRSKRVWGLSSGRTLVEVPFPLNEIATAHSDPRRNMFLAAIDTPSGPVAITATGRVLTTGALRLNDLRYENLWQLVDISHDCQSVLLKEPQRVNRSPRWGRLGVQSNGQVILETGDQTKQEHYQPGAVCIEDRPLNRTFHCVQIIGGQLVLARNERKQRAVGLFDEMVLRGLQVPESTPWQSFEPTPIPPQFSRLGLKSCVRPDGSRLWLDPRGLLHLQSSDLQIPELTIVLTEGGNTAGWCADGSLWGDAYFLGGSGPRVLARSIYAEVLSRFIGVTAAG